MERLLLHTCCAPCSVYCVESLRDEGIPVYPIPVEDTTRVNIFLNDGSQEYKLVGEGARVPPDAQAQLLALLEAARQKNTPQEHSAETAQTGAKSFSASALRCHS